MQSYTQFKLPFPVSKKGIADKIEYAEHERNKLSDAINDAYKLGDKEPKFLSQIAENIFSNTRECFDHLAIDIIEGHLIEHVPEKMRTAYNSGKKREYFPFYLDMLKNEKSIFSKCKSINPYIYSELFTLANAIKNKEFLINTSFRVDHFVLINDAVNLKKHSKVLEYIDGKNDLVFVSTARGDYIFPKDFRNDDPNFRILLPEGVKGKRVGSYVLACNRLEIWGLCLFAVHATAIVMDLFYDKFFQQTGYSIFKPEPPPIFTYENPPLEDGSMPDPSKYRINLDT